MHVINKNKQPGGIGDLFLLLTVRDGFKITKDPLCFENHIHLQKKA